VRLEAIAKTRLTWDDSPPAATNSPEAAAQTCDEPALDAVSGVAKGKGRLT
jgi:hypothetical protein